MDHQDNIRSQNVLLCEQIPHQRLQSFWGQYQLSIIVSDHNNDVIPGSFWGDSEAGLIANRLYIRNNTPLHSLFHEACHYVCMDKQRRDALDTNAGGDYDEENAVCYLQILLANRLEGFSSQRMMDDMDTWGYSFRLGSAQQWFLHDAEDAKAWLIDHQIISTAMDITFQLNQ
ncbi:MAG: hypothetical protein KAH22_01770 [Thiotrichaceae bacterium]|nr:hypothetical protein [Thiotrichaceae bacterium]